MSAQLTKRAIKISATEMHRKHTRQSAHARLCLACGSYLNLRGPSQSSDVANPEERTNAVGCDSRVLIETGEAVEMSLKACILFNYRLGHLYSASSPRWARSKVWRFVTSLRPDYRKYLSSEILYIPYEWFALQTPLKKKSEKSRKKSKQRPSMGTYPAWI